MDETQDRVDHAPWPERALILAALGAVSGVLFHQLTDGGASDANTPFVTFLAVFGAALAFSLERLRWQWSVLFATGGALVAGLVAWWNGQPDNWSADDGWQFVAALTAVAVAVPLFQAARDEGRLRFVPAAVHAHAWTNIILWGAACAFVGVTMLLTLLLSELFGLIGVHFLRDLLRDGWFAPTLACAAFGGAVGLLRDRDVVTSILQRVGRTILSVLAPVLAAGLVFFVLALPLTGLDALWEQTKETTPIVLACMFGALILTNAVAGNSAEEEAQAPVLRWSAMALAATMVPLAAVAALSTGQRIAQHGFTPDRLWAAVFVAVAAAVALGYAWALLRGRFAWPAPLRQTNVRLAAGICLLALFLSLPIVSFGALSARDQVARLESGKIAPDKFDWAALRYDFGPAGRKALERLSAAGPYKAFAAKALQSRDRWALREPEVAAPPLPPQVRVDGGVAVPLDLMAAVADSRRCGSERDRCRLAIVSPAQAVLVSGGCDDCPSHALLFERRSDGRWATLGGTAPEGQVELNPRLTSSGRIEVREVTKRQVFIDGKPAGAFFD
jgi:hypothetical protein